MVIIIGTCNIPHSKIVRECRNKDTKAQHGSSANSALGEGGDFHKTCGVHRGIDWSR